MIGENQQLVADEQVEFEKNLLKFKTAGKSPIILEEFIKEYPPHLLKETPRMSRCSQLDLQTLGS